VELFDDSALHAGHEGAKSGAHYRLFVVSSAFAGKPQIARHRLVYSALDELMKTRIHALSIRLMTPEEAQ
jgi:BolA protein